MATEQQPAVTVLGRPREPVAPSPTPSDLAGSEPPQPIEFRGFEYFAQRDFNEFKDASRAYFAKNDAPSSWLGDATPPASAHPSLDESRTAPGPASYQSSEKEPKKEKLILGLRRQWFWTVLAIILVVLIVAIGVGVGVSTTRAASSSKSAGVVGPTSNDTSTTTTTPTPTHVPTASSSSTQVPTATPGAAKECPEINGTVYKVPGSTKQFLQLCAVDSGKQDGAIDIRNVYTETADDCIDNCAGTSGCTGCGWGFIKGDQGPPYRCWLKSNVKHKSHYANASWHFAVLL
ncbi:hypothetical protein F5X97DRAFT_299243 [Nemania serpens]|nr:hypothetical protein F5X97DRAFT_299243 [Nemania serpens]